MGDVREPRPLGWQFRKVSSVEQAEMVSERAYQSGQGYEMTRLYRVHAEGVGPQKVRVMVHRGNSTEYTWAKADRWDGAEWQSVVRLAAAEIGADGAPTYVCWRHDDRATKSRIRCMGWLERESERTLKNALEVLL